MKYKILILTLGVTIASVLSVYAQCTNNISVNSNINRTTNKGMVMVDIVSDTNFTCTLVIESATGDTLVEKRKARGNKTIEFKSLELGKLYLVRVEFSGNNDFLCNKLSKTILLK